ncbi:DUF2268 domain-containing putative Zn-dependent protease [Planococcus beigongshangi]|uniref:DUF2268 domain-containing putative Zn-dependent protease n=1 Tax=Planococcus beigongshangi TaxID=2782536 RepID=UPI00193BAC32
MDNIDYSKKIGLAILLTIMLTGCSADSGETVSPTEQTATAETTDDAAGQQAPAIVEAGDQQFKIFSYHEAFSQYVALAKEEQDSRDLVYSEMIFQPFRQNAFHDGGGSEFEDLGVFNPPQNGLSMQSTLDALAGKNEDFQSAIEKALIKSAELLPGGDKTVHIFPATPADGSGMALNAEVMILWVHPTLSAEELEQTVAHEYFHLIDMEKGVFESATADSTLLEATIMEGKAVAFALLNYPETDLSWLSNEDGKVTEQVHNLFLEQKDSYDLQVWGDFLNGNPAKGIPPYANYIIGHEIMQSFLLNHPGLSVDEWLKMTAEEILQGSGYGE